MGNTMKINEQFTLRGAMWRYAVPYHGNIACYIMPKCNATHDSMVLWL